MKIHKSLANKYEEKKTIRTTCITMCIFAVCNTNERKKNERNRNTQILNILKAGMSYIWFPWYVTGLTFCDHVVHSSISHIVTCATFFFVVVVAYKIVFFKKIYNFIRQNITIFIYIKMCLGKTTCAACVWLTVKSNIQLYNSRLNIVFFSLAFHFCRFFFVFLIKTHKNVLCTVRFYPVQLL